MTLIKRNLPSISNKKPGTTGVFNLPVGGLRYAELLIQLTKGTDAKRQLTTILKEMRLKVNGRLVQRLRAEQIEYIRNYHGQKFSTHYVGNDLFLKVYFAEPWLATPGGQDHLGAGTSNIQSFQLELDISPSATESELLMEGTSSVDAIAEPLGNHLEILNSSIPANGAGRITYTGLPRDAIYRRLHFFSDKILSLTITINNNEIYSMTKGEAMADQALAGYTPTASVFSVPFDIRRRITEYLDARGSSEFTIELEMDSGATQFQLVSEQMRALNG